jgi:hypothetical protein
MPAPPGRGAWTATQRRRPRGRHSQGHLGLDLANDGTPVLGDPTTAAGVRTLAMPALAIVAIRERLDRYVRPDAAAWLFIGDDGDPLRAQTFNQARARARARIGRADLAAHHLSSVPARHRRAGSGHCRMITSRRAPSMPLTDGTAIHPARGARADKPNAAMTRLRFHEAVDAIPRERPRCFGGGPHSAPHPRGGLTTSQSLRRSRRHQPACGDARRPGHLCRVVRPATRVSSHSRKRFPAQFGALPC